MWEGWVFDIKKHLKEAKSVATVLGAIDALVGAGQLWVGVGGRRSE